MTGVEVELSTTVEFTTGVEVVKVLSTGWGTSILVGTPIVVEGVRVLVEMALEKVETEVEVGVYSVNVMSASTCGRGAQLGGRKMEQSVRLTQRRNSSSDALLDVAASTFISEITIRAPVLDSR